METTKFNKTECGVEVLINSGEITTLPDNYFTREIYNTDFFEILFFEKAKGKIILNQKAISLNNYTFIFISPFQKRSWEINKSDLKGQFLIFQENFLNEFFADKLFTYRLLYFYQLKYPLSLIVNSIFYKKLEKILKEINVEIKKPKCDSPHIVRSLHYFLLMKLNREYVKFHRVTTSTPDNNYAYQFKQLLEINIREKQRIEDYTSALGISRITLNKAVQSQFNISASELIKGRLLYEIQDELVYSNKTINEIALGLNFSEPNHMMRFFKQNTGLTASVFRRNYQNGSI